MLWFITASLISLSIGLVLVNLFQPGHYINLSQADTEGVKDLMTKKQEFSLEKFVEHIIPRSVMEAMATNEVLQLVVFSIFFGSALAYVHHQQDEGTVIANSFCKLQGKCDGEPGDD